MPVLGGKPVVEERKPAPATAKPVPVKVVEPEPPTKPATAAPVKVVEPSPPKVEAPAEVPHVDAIRPPAGGVVELPIYDETFSLEDNYRHLHRDYLEAASGQEKSQAKVDGLVEVVKQLSDLVR